MSRCRRAACVMLIVLSGCAPRDVGVCVNSSDGQVASRESDARNQEIIAKFDAQLRSMEDEVKKLQADLSRERERLTESDRASAAIFKKLIERIGEIPGTSEKSPWY